MPFVKTPYLIKKIYPELVWHVPTSKRKIYLTFDDGPIPEVTPFVLQQLKTFNAKATFFCVGDNVEKNSGIYNDIINAGHATGNHTHQHLNGWFTKNQTYIDSVSQCSNFVTSNLFRPPYGRMTRKQIKALSPFYKIIMWDVLSCDYDKDVSQEKVLQNVLKNTAAGSIIVMHDSLKAKENLQFALPKILEHYTKAGFVFEKLD